MKFGKKSSKSNPEVLPVGKKKKKKTVIILLIVLIIAALAAAAYVFSIKDGGDEKREIMTTKPSYGNISLSVTGSGTVAPYDRYEIVPLVNGEIVECNYDVGDTVREDDILYVFDHSEQDKQIDSAKNAITRAKIRNKTYLDATEYAKTLAKYTVKAEGDGVISGFNLKVDDEVQAKSKVGTIQDKTTFKAIVPFNAAQCAKIQIGDEATVNLYPSMYSVSGKVTYKSSASSGYSSGAVVYDVEITVTNASIALTDTSASAVVYTSEGNAQSPKSGTLEYMDALNIMPEVSGKILTVSPGIKDGATVKKGDVLFVIDSSDFEEEKTLAEFDYSDLEINLENAYDRLEDYEIKAPISGTIITKNSKKGDTISGNNSVTLMVIADMSAMKFSFQADETDVDKIEVGQRVIVTADAVENKIFTGEVTSVATEGQSQNGVSQYEVEVVIQDYGQNSEDGCLRSGMNVSAEIIYESAENELLVPVSAITKIGNESYAFVKSNRLTTNTAKDAEKEEPGEESMPAAEKDGKEEKADKQERNDGKFDPAAENDEDKNADRAAAIEKMIAEKTPDGFKAVKVETGVTDGVNIAIISGLTEEDEVYIDENSDVQVPVTNQGMQMQAGFGGGNFGGGGNRGGGNFGGGPGGGGGGPRG